MIVAELFTEAVQHHKAGRLNDAIALYDQILAVKTALPEAHFNLANALKSQGRLDQAVDSYRRAIAIRPAFAGAHNNLGNVFKSQGGESGATRTPFPAQGGQRSGDCGQQVMAA